MRRGALVGVLLLVASGARDEDDPLDEIVRVHRATPAGAPSVYRAADAL